MATKQNAPAERRPNLAQVDLSKPISFGKDGYVAGVERPTYDSLVDTVLAENEDPYGPSGNEMVLGFVTADGKSVYRGARVWGMGSWMGVVAGLKNAGFVDLLEGVESRRFDALIAPSAKLLDPASLAHPGCFKVRPAD